MNNLFGKMKRRISIIMGLLSIFSLLTGCRNKVVDGPGMERIGAELTNVTDTAKIEGYWSEDNVGYVLEIFDNQVIVRSGIVQLETDIVNRNGKLYLSYADLISSPNNQVYGYISDFQLKEDDTVLIKVFLEGQRRTAEHILKRVDYPYSFERMDSLLAEIVGTYISDSGEEVTIKNLDTMHEKTGRTRHDCGYSMITKRNGEEKQREDFFLGNKKYKDELTIVSTTDFGEGFIVRKNADDEYELVSLIIEMGEDQYRTWEEVYRLKKVQ